MDRLLRVGIALMGLLCSAVCLGAEPLPRSVLVLDAAEPNSPWGIEFRAVLRSALSVETGASVAIYSEVLDLARFNTTDYEELLHTYLPAKYRDKSIGVIVVHGPQALNILMRLRADLWPTVPVVFASVDDDTIAQLSLPPDITGTILRLRLGNMVTAARVLVPNLKTVALVGDPYERQPFRKHFSRELPQLAGVLEIINLLGWPMDELKQRVAALPANSAIIFVPLYVDRNGGIYISRDALGQISKAANRPIVSDVATHIGYGSTGGLMSVPGPVAEATASLTLRILNGEKAANIPITVGNPAKPIFDWRQLQRFGISENSLPPGSEIRYRPHSMWEEYRPQMAAIVAALLVQAALITWLVLERHRRRRAQFEARGRLMEVLHLNRTATAGVLSASFAHEIAQPLAGILSNAEAAELYLEKDPPDVGMVKTILADIRRDDDRATEIIRHLGGLLKRKVHAELREFDVNDAVRDALYLLKPEARRRAIELSASLSPRALPVRADPVHLQQVILNLAANGMDAMVNCAPGDRRLVLQTTLIDDTAAHVSVVDTGVGIPPGKLEDVFRPFFTTKPHGTGIGLSISHAILHMYGGKIWAENVPEGGAAFRFRVPLAKAQSS